MQVLFIEGGYRVSGKVPGITFEQAGVKMESLVSPPESNINIGGVEETIETVNS